jgi:hypothetical protein
MSPQAGVEAIESIKVRNNNFKVEEVEGPEE